MSAEWGPEPGVAAPGLFSVGKPQTQVSLECLELPEVRGRRSWAGNAAQRLRDPSR